MNPRHITMPLTAFCLLTILVGRLQAQVTPPVPDKGVAALVAVLESEGPVFDKAKACQQLAIVGDASAVPALATLLSDEHLSTYARSALEAIPGDEADKALQQAAETLDGDCLLGVLHSIGKRGDARAIPTLSKRLAAEDRAVQNAAARALAHIGTLKAADILEEAFSKSAPESRPSVAWACLICAQRLAAEGETQKAVALCNLLRNADLPEDLHRAATYNTILAQGKAGIPLLLQMLDSGDQAQIRMALQAARRLGAGVNLSAELTSRFKKQSAKTQSLLLIVLGDLGDTSVLPLVLEAAKNGAGEVRIRAIAALAQLGDESCAAVLFEAVRGPDQAVIDAACAAIVALKGDQFHVRAVEMLGASDSRVVLSAIEIASKRNIAAATGPLLQLARSDDATIRHGAIQALGRTAALDDLPKLIGLTIETLPSEDSKIVQKALKSACVRMPQGRCAEALASTMPEVSSAVRVILLEQLAVIGGPKALETVVATAKSNDDAMQDAATRLLGGWLTADAAPAMLDLSKTLTNSKYQLRALRGYIRIARQLNMTTDERMEVCRNALALSNRNEEKKLVLEVLRRYPSPDGLQTAKSLLENGELKKAAQSTVQVIAKAIAAATPDEAGFVPLFNGKTLDGWKGDMKFWRAENGGIVGGSLTEMVKHNQFLRTEKEYGNFELRLQFKLLGQRTNAGVQVRTQEIPDHHEVSGYQADLGDGWWGCLYDESRRRKVLAGPPQDQRAKPVRVGDWNDYRIRCEGKRIQLWLNGVQTVDYTELDRDIPQTGIIALQVHGNLKMEAAYRNIRIKEL